jgi:hypothetical protein
MYGYYNATSRTQHVYKMLKPWVIPAVGSYDPPTGTEYPTWARQYHTSAVAWTGAGFSGEDSDLDTDVGDSTAVGASSWTPVDFHSENLDALVEGWIQETTPNYGLAMYGDPSTYETLQNCATETYATAGYRPLLTIIYEVPGGGLEGPLLGGKLIRGGVLRRRLVG